MAYYDRYLNLRNSDNTVNSVPFIKIPELNTDKYELYREGITRFDKLSSKYYGNSTYGWLISLANPSKRLEFDFEGNDIIRIPFPLENALQNYDEQIKKYNNY